MTGDQNKLVFVSYAHADDEFMKKELLPFLEDLELDEQIELWHDRMIGTGENWYAEIADRLDHAKVAILLVTQEFLRSSFCRLEEVPILLQRARRGELRILPLFAEPCLWQIKPWLRRAQMWPTDGKAVSEHGAPRRRRLMTEFAQRVLAAVDAPATAGTSQRHFDEPHPTHDLHRMPKTGSLLFGRSDELRLLDTAWHEGTTNIVVFSASGGVGKSTLARVWAEMLAEDEWRGAERAFAWSFYSQGTGRMTDADGFINYALAWFGDDTPKGLSPWDRGERLAHCVRHRRTMLILDGVEPLQSGDEGIDRGSIRDPGLRTLLEELAKDNPGLCVVTTRERLTDLGEYDASVFRNQDLDQVSRLAGRALLRVDRIRGSDEALEATVEDLGRHALAVSLLSSLLTDENPSPHVANTKALPALAHPVEQGGHPRRVLDAWVKRLGDSPEIEFLHIVGLFDRPAPRDAIRAVIDGSPLRGLNKHLRKATLGDVLERLRKVRLIARQSTHEDTIDAHPIVREHFGERLKAQHAKGWREGHQRLYKYYAGEAEYQPDHLEGMQPLFAAVLHGCAAGLHEEVAAQVYFERILRREEVYLVHKLGAFAADLSCLAHFFAVRWDQPEPGLSDPAQRGILNGVSFDLRGIGRLREAATSLEGALNRVVSGRGSTRSAVDAGMLSEIYLVLGELRQAETRAREGVVYADKSGDVSQSVLKRSTHATALHQLGQISEARTLFAQCEQMQSEKPLLYSVRGYHYCDLLLGAGEADEVLRRAGRTLKWVTEQGWLLDVGLDHLNLGRAHLATVPPNASAAEEHIRAAVEGLRTAGVADYLPRGLLGRAEFHRTQGNMDLALRDIDEVRTVVSRTGMRLFEADLELEQTRWCLANNDLGSARTALAKAKGLIEAIGYGRRRPDIEALGAGLLAAGSG